MTEFEDELKRALARQQPSPDFTARVMAQVGAQKAPVWRWPAIAAAASVLLIGGGTYRYQEHQREVQGEAAKQQLLVALRIAGTKLHMAQEQVQEIETTEVNQ